MFKKRMLYVVIVIVMVMTELMACKSTTGAGGGGTMIVGRGGDSVSLDAATVTDGESWRVAGEIIEPLVRLEGTSAKPVPWLAESWESADSQTWTFHQFNLNRFRGMTVRIQFGVYNDGLGDVTTLYVDDASLQVCP